MSLTPARPDAVEFLEEVTKKTPDLRDMGQVIGSGGIPPDLTREYSPASPRLIPAPDSLHLYVQLPPDSLAGDKGPVSASFDRKCAASRAPATDTADYDQLSYGELHGLRTQRGYRKKDTKTAPRTRVAAADVAKKKHAGGSSRDMDTSMSALGERYRPMGDTMDTGEAADGNIEERQRGEALEIALAVALEVAKEHAQWWKPELEPQVDAHHPSGVEGVDSAASA